MERSAALKRLASIVTSVLVQLMAVLTECEWMKDVLCQWYWDADTVDQGCGCPCTAVESYRSDAGEAQC